MMCRPGSLTTARRRRAGQPAVADGRSRQAQGPRGAAGLPVSALTRYASIQAAAAVSRASALPPVLTSPSMPPSDLQDFAEHLIVPGLSTIDGVAQVNIFGAKRFDQGA